MRYFSLQIVPETRALAWGAVCCHSWMFQKWEEGYIHDCKPSIEYLELFAVAAGVLRWADCFSNRRVVLFCDNISVVFMINKASSSCKNCMVLIRMITLHCLVHNVRIFAKYISSGANKLADYLSRLRIQDFKQEAARIGLGLDQHSTAVPESLWPASKLWIH